MAQTIMAPGEKTSPFEVIEHEIQDFLDRVLANLDIPKKIA